MANDNMRYWRYGSFMRQHTDYVTAGSQFPTDKIFTTEPIQIDNAKSPTAYVAKFTTPPGAKAKVTKVIVTVTEALGAGNTAKLGLSSNSADQDSVIEINLNDSHTVGFHTFTPVEGAAGSPGDGFDESFGDQNPLYVHLIQQNSGAATGKVFVSCQFEVTGGTLHASELGV